MIDDSRSAPLPTALEPDIVLPAQWFVRRSALPESERRLRLAILKDALHYYRDFAGGTDRRTRAWYDDAAEWFASRDRSEPFAFENVCDALGLSASAIRCGLRRGSADPDPLHRHAA